MKKKFSVVFAFVLCAVLVTGCSQKNDSPEASQPETLTATSHPGEPDALQEEGAAPEESSQSPEQGEAKEPVQLEDQSQISSRSGTQVFSLSGQGSITESGSFTATEGQVLTVTATSAIVGGTVDLFFFSPTNEETHLTFGETDDVQVLQLSAGTWAYNCTGFFESGSITIIGMVE